MGAVTSGLLAAAIGIVGSLTGAPLVAQLNNIHAKSKDQAEYRRARIVEWKSLLHDSSTDTQLFDFRQHVHYASLKRELSDSFVDRVDQLFQHRALHFVFLSEPGVRDFQLDFQDQVAEIESKWKLI